MEYVLCRCTKNGLLLMFLVQISSTTEQKLHAYKFTGVVGRSWRCYFVVWPFNTENNVNACFLAFLDLSDFGGVPTLWNRRTPAWRLISRLFLFIRILSPILKVLMFLEWHSCNYWSIDVPNFTRLCFRSYLSLYASEAVVTLTFVF